MIPFDCPFCGRTLSLADELRGRDVPCPECKREITVPDITEDPNEAPDSVPEGPPPPQPSPSVDNRSSGAVAVGWALAIVGAGVLVVFGTGISALICLPALFCGMAALAKRRIFSGIGILILSLFGVGVPVLAGVLSAVAAHRQLECKSNLRQIGIEMIKYVDNYGSGRYYPTRLAELHERKLVNELELFVCLCDPDPVPFHGAPGGSTPRTSYEFVTEIFGQRLSDETLADMPVVWDRAPFHRGVRNVLFLDGHVEAIPEAAFQQLLSRRGARKSE